MGTINTAYIDMFTQDLMVELQKTQSSYNFVDLDRSLGDKTYFDIIGKAHAVPQTQRLQMRELQTPEFERRYFVRIPYELPLALDRQDENKVARQLKGDYLRLATAGVLRYRDMIITNALLGNANVQEDGVLTPTALPSSQIIAVNFNGYRETAVTGNVGLTIDKVNAAMALLEANYANPMGVPIHVIGHGRQLRGMLAHAQRQGVNTQSGLSPHSISDMGALTAFLGVTLHVNNEIPLDSSGYDQVIVMTEDAIKAGASDVLKVFSGESLAHIGNPYVLAVYEDMGAVRTFEEKVVVIKCHAGTNNVPSYAVS